MKGSPLLDYYSHPETERQYKTGLEKAKDDSSKGRQRVPGKM